MAKLDWIDVDSSNVSRVAYHEDTETLAVQFHNGGLYTYSDVSEHTYQNLIGADSVGKYLNNVVKVLHPYTKWDDQDELLNSL